MSKIAKVFLFTVIFFLIVDATVGKYIFKKFVKKELLDINTQFSQYDEIYDHKFLKNLNSIQMGDLRYKLCTDDNSFKVSCNSIKKQQKNYDIVFIGDSFTEGLGYNYEETFVGIIAKNLKDKKIANLAMSSYSPSIYFTKIKNLVSSGYKFKEVIVFIDVSDLADDILCYEVEDNIKVKRRETFPRAGKILIKKRINL